MARHLWSQPTSCASPPHLANTDWDKIGESKMEIWGFGMKIVQKESQMDGHCIRQNMAIGPWVSFLVLPFSLKLLPGPFSPLPIRNIIGPGFQHQLFVQEICCDN